MPKKHTTNQIIPPAVWTSILDRGTQRGGKGRGEGGRGRESGTVIKEEEQGGKGERGKENKHFAVAVIAVVVAATTTSPPTTRLPFIHYIPVSSVS